MGLFPSEQEQIAYIDQAERVEPTPFAFSFTQEDIDDVLRLVSNSNDNRMVVAAAFQEQKSTAEIAALMQKQYHGGAGLKSENGEFSVWYAEDGIHLAKGRSARYKTTVQVISWETAAERIGQLMENGNFATNVELNWNKVLERYENLIRNGRYFTPEEKAEYEEMQTAEWKSRQSYNNYNDIKHEHPNDIVLFQVGDFFEMYGEDAKTAANILDLHLTTRPIAGAGRVEMCGVPAHALEQYVEKLRATNSVTIAAVNSVINEHIAYSLGVLGADKELHEVETEPVSVTEALPVTHRKITHAEIDEALQRWNGDMNSKRAVVRYMADHARERDTAAWLAREYGTDSSKPLHITVTNTDIDYEMSWGKVQRRIAQLIKTDSFFTEQEKEAFEDIDPVTIRENLAQRGIVNGEVVDPEKLDADPFIQQVMADVEQIATENDRFHVVEVDRGFQTAYSVKNGIILLLIAFLVSPMGLPMLAVWLLGKLQGANAAIKNFLR